MKFEEEINKVPDWIKKAIFDMSVYTNVSMPLSCLNNKVAMDEIHAVLNKYIDEILEGDIETMEAYGKKESV